MSLENEMSEQVKSSGRLTVSTAVFAQRCSLYALMVETDGTNAATVIVYDNATAASGTILAKMIVPGTSSGREVVFPYGVKALNGLYVSIAGTGAPAATIHFG